MRKIFYFGEMVQDTADVEKTQNSTSIEVSTEDQDCQVPDWAKKIGHEEKWKLHHGCQ